MKLARTRHQAIRNVSAGGAVQWGPDFGGTDGDQFGAVADLALTTLALDGGDLGAVADLTLELSATMEEMGCVANVSSISYDVDLTRGADSAVNDGPDNWTNPGNATGLQDSNEASRVGQVLVVTDANLRLGYADFSGGMETFNIGLVLLRFDTRQTGTAANNGGLHHEYRLVSGGAWTSLEVFTADVDNNPKTYDVTAAVGGDWAKLNALEVRVRAVLPTGTALVNCFCNAVHVTVSADKEFPL